MLHLTSPSNSIYIEATLGFYDARTGSDVINMRTMNLLGKCIGNCGLNGLDRLLG